MTDSLKGVHVAFEKDIRDDDAEPIINAIKAIRGVADVTGDVCDLSDWTNRAQVKIEIRQKLLELYKSI